MLVFLIHGAQVAYVNRNTLLAAGIVSAVAVAAGKQLRINVYNKPDDGNGGLFTFTDLTPYEPTTPQPGAYYRLVTRATDTRSGRAIELVCKDSPLVTDEATQATVGQLWSNTPITDEADTIQKYQYWQFVADPDGSGKYAIVNKAWPEGSVNPTATSTELSGRWTYDYTTRHYNFVLGAGGNVGNANGVDFYDISSDQHPGYYFNSAPSATPPRRGATTPGPSRPARQAADSRPSP